VPADFSKRVEDDEVHSLARSRTSEDVRVSLEDPLDRHKLPTALVKSGTRDEGLRGLRSGSEHSAQDRLAQEYQQTGQTRNNLTRLRTQQYRLLLDDETNNN
jgi:hypothetical protein